MKDDRFKHLTIFHDYGKVSLWYVEKFERDFNCYLPQTYKELMLNHNGVGFYESDFDFVNSKGEDDSRQLLFKSFGKKENTTESIEDAQLYVSHPDYHGISGMIAFASTGEGDALCFDYREDPETCEPKVILMIHDDT